MNLGFIRLHMSCFDAGKSITRTIGRGLGPGNRDAFEPCWACWHRAVRQCHLGPKNSRFPGHNPLPLAQVMVLSASKHYVQGRINQRSIGSFVYMSFFVPTGDFNRLYRTAPPPHISLYRPEQWPVE
jgi:hypothetical protein